MGVRPRSNTSEEGDVTQDSTASETRLLTAAAEQFFTFDEQEFGAVGGRLRLESPGGSDIDGRYDIEISGGAAHLRITTE
jgi:hypothetical protein